MNEFKNELQKLENQGLRRSLKNFDPAKVLNVSSNDYLGLSSHPAVISEAEKALKDSGVGGTSSRLLAGTSRWHKQCEDDLSSFLGKEAGLVFSSGFHANSGILPALAGPDDMIFVDKLCHASILDGIRLSKARFCSFDHNDPDHLEGLLAKRRKKYKKAFIVTEGIFSMDGDFGMLPEIVFLARKWEALVYLDEAHSLGVIGPDGKGLAAQHNLVKDVDIFVGTLSKTLGSQGGFVLGSQEMIDLIVSKSRSFIYTTALAPACAAGASAALRLLPSLQDRRDLMSSESEAFREFLQRNDFNTMTSQSQIVPVWAGSVEETKRLSDYLLSAGFFVPSIRPPTVPEAQGRVRLSLTFDIVKKGLSGLKQTFQSYLELQEARAKIGQTT